MRSLTVFVLICLLSWVPSLARAGEPLTLLGTIPDEGKQPSFDGFNHGEFVYSRWDKTGNTREIVTWDPRTQVNTVLFPGKPGVGRLLNRSDEILFVTGRGRFTFQLTALDKTSGHTVGNIGLNQEIGWARVQGRELLASQPRGDGLILDLPSLRVKRAVSLPAHRHAAGWKDQVVLLGRSLSLYDSQWNLVGEVGLPARESDKNCEPGPLVVANDKAVLGFGCGDILVVDLPSRTLERHIAGRSMFAAIAVVDGLILRVNADIGRQPHETTAYELATGEELGPLPLQATEIHAHGTFLAAVDRRGWLEATAAFYTVDTREIRSRRWPLAQMKAHCSVPPRAGEDPYPFLDACEAAGIRSVAHPAFASQLRAQLDAYAAALAMTRPDPAPSLPVATPAPVSFTAQQDRLHFSGDRLYVGRWRCGTGESKGVGVTTHDRGTLAEIAETTLLECDTGDNAEIVSMATDQRYLYVVMQQPGDGLRERRNSLHLVDRRTLAVIEVSDFEGDLGLLTYQDGVLLSCSCTGTGGNGTCRIITPRPLALVADAGHTCVGVQDLTVPVIEPAGNAQAEPPLMRFDGDAARTRSYQVRATQNTDYAHPLVLVVRPLAGGASPRFLRVERATSWLTSEEGDWVIVSRAMSEKTRLLSVDLHSGRQRTLGEFRSTPGVPFHVTMDSRHAYVVSGRDLLVLDLATGRLHATRRGLIDPASPDDEIVRLLLDRGRLLVFTRKGTSSRILSLEASGRL